MYHSGLWALVFHLHDRLPVDCTLPRARRETHYRALERRRPRTDVTRKRGIPRRADPRGVQGLACVSLGACVHCDVYPRVQCYPVAAERRDGPGVRGHPRDTDGVSTIWTWVCRCSDRGLDGRSVQETILALRFRHIGVDDCPHCAHGREESRRALCHVLPDDVHVRLSYSRPLMLVIS